MSSCKNQTEGYFAAIREMSGKNESTVQSRMISLLYKMARHVINVDELSPRDWGIKGVKLLEELRELDPDTYDALMS